MLDLVLVDTAVAEPVAVIVQLPLLRDVDEAAEIYILIGMKS